MPRQFGTFQAVFVPTLLTILGVIMFLRLPWVVGNVGLVGALVIIGIAYVITITTALSMSSITTNIQMGPGGAYSIISQSLGLEVGGSVGISFYLSQTLAVAMYVFGFREGLQWILPSANPLGLDLLTFGIAFLIVVRSADLAFRIQYGILAVIVASLVAVFATMGAGSWTAPAATLDLDPPRARSGSSSPCSSPRPRASWPGRTCPGSSRTRGVRSRSARSPQSA